MVNYVVRNLNYFVPLVINNKSKLVHVIIDTIK